VATVHARAAQAGPGEGAAASARPGRGRRVLVWMLFAVASLLTLVLVLTLWVDRQMLDNKSFRTASQELIEDPAIQNALSVYVVNQLYDNVDVPAALENRLPDQLDRLAAPLAGALRQPATNGVNAILQRPRVQQLWVNVAGTAHQKLINVLENKTGYGISTGNGVVTLDLSQLVSDVGASLGLPEAALDKLPADAGVITVMKSNQLKAAQTGVLLVKALSLWLSILALGLYALAIYLARGFRRRMLRNVGWALVGIGLVVLAIRRLTGNYVVDTLTSPQYHAPVRETWLIETAILGQIARASILYGLIVLFGALLAGPTRAATAARRRISPLLNERQAAAWGGVGLAFLILVAWGGTHALRQWWGILLVGALLAAGLVALRRQTLREFPPGTRSAGAFPGDGAPAVVSPAEEISKLSELHHAGTISDAEFERAKAVALSSS
jgi:hypothetical protein